MTASSTSSSDTRRARGRARRTCVACAVVVAALLAATAPINAALVEREFATSSLGREATAAAETAAGRPLVAIVGSSQAQTGIDALRVEERLRGAGAPVVANVAAGGLHASVYPYLVRRLAAQAELDLVVLELGHIAHDQYGGAWTVRNFVEDEAVVDAFAASGTPRARQLLDLRADERRFPWLATSRLLRVVYDGSRRDDRGVTARMRERRGFQPYGAPKDFDAVVRSLEHDPAYDAPDLVDASPQRVFVAVAKVCAEICRARGVPMVVLLEPVNRDVAARVKVVRHFEATAKSETVPALRALGIETLVPPDRFYASRLYYDHVHFHADGAREFTHWLAGEIERVRAAR